MRLLALFPVAALSLLGCSTRSTTVLQCSLNSECASGQRCVLGMCRAQCATSVDCERSGEVCIQASGGTSGYCGVLDASVGSEASVGEEASISPDGVAPPDVQVPPDVQLPPDVAPPPPEPRTRPLAPLSTSRASGTQPSLRWRVSTMDRSPTSIQLCRDRALTMGCQTVATGSGTSARPAAPLAAGQWFWQLQGLAAPAPVWQFAVSARSNAVDSSWGSTLDLNGDGLADLVVGADDVRGAAHVYLGRTGTPGTTPTLTLLGPDGPAGYFGVSVASAGDVNGDGFGDLLVGAYGADSGGGRAHLFLGSATGVASAPQVSLTNPGGSRGDNFGYYVASAGDLNGDGYADVAVGAWKAASSAGRAYVYLGGAAGLSTTPAFTLAPDPGGGYFGYALSSGDLNGDGYADLAVGAYSSNRDRGQVYVYQGSAAGIATTASAILDPPSGAPDEFGVALSAAADLDGDGYADLAVGANGGLVSDRGSVFVYAGSSTGLRGAPSTRVPGGAGYYGSAVACAGDLNRDGFDDLLVGSYAVNSYAGLAQLYLGNATGVTTTPAASLPPPNGANSYFGYSLAGAGDHNGDGFADLLVGAYYSFGQVGRAHLYLGTMAGTPNPSGLTLAPPSNSPGEFGASVALRSALSPRSLLGLSRSAWRL